MLNIKELEKQFDELLNQTSVEQFKEWLAKKEAEEVEVFSTIKHEFSNHGIEMVIEDIYFNDGSWERIMSFKCVNTHNETWDNDTAILDCQKNGFTFDNLVKYNSKIPYQFFLNNEIPIKKLFDRADTFKSKII